MTSIFSAKRGGLLVLCALVSLMVSCGGGTGNKLSFEDMRLRYRESLVGRSPLDLSDSVVAGRIARIDQNAETCWQSLNKAPDRTWLWEDCNQEGISTNTLVPYSRLLSMAMAWATDGSRFEGNDSLKRDIIAGMDWMYENRYNPSIPLYDNWWMFVIGTPLNIDNVMVLLYDEFTEEQKANYIAAMNYYAPNVTYEGASTGANKIWQCNSMALRGILAQDSTMIRMAVDGLQTEFKIVRTHDGFYEDGSFVQHQWHPYTGGYGRSLLAQLTDMVNLVQGSPWEVPQDQLDMLYGWVHNAYEPLMFRGAMMDMVRGREVSRPGAGDRGTGHSILVSMFKLSQSAPEPERSRLQRAVKQQAQEDTFRDLIMDIPLYLVSDYRAMMADDGIQPAEPVTLHKQFSAMDRVVHKTPGFALGLAMSSARIENYETINDENLKGWYTADGMIYLFDGDLRQYSENFWPTVDPYRLAGTTVDTRPREAKTLPLAPGLLYADGYKSPQRWVGGASVDSLYGAVGMWLDAYGSTLEAKKSWFMAGGEIVCLGAGIHSTDGRTIETTIENRKLNADADYVLTLDGQPVLAQNGRKSASAAHWVHFAGTTEGTAVGYYFPQPTAVNLLREDRTGNWIEINYAALNMPDITKGYFTLWTDHGKNPQGATYAYVLLPGLSADQTARYAEHPTVEILANDARVQAVRHDSYGVTGVNFWEAGRLPVAGIHVDAPCSVVIREADGQLTVGVSDPTQVNEAGIEVTLDRSVGEVLESNPNVEVVSLSPLTLRIHTAGQLGRTLQTTYAI